MATAQAKVFIVDDADGEAYCGPGMSELLRAVSRNGQVRQACTEMGMSYSKGWKLLSRLEKWLGAPAALRKQGGRGGGNAALTPEGEAFLAKHTAFEADCRRAVEDIFRRYYG